MLGKWFGYALFGIVVVGLSACASVRKDDRVPDRVTLETDREEYVDNAQSPLYDLNLKQEEIPVLLKRIEDIYAEPPQRDRCIFIKAEVYDLTYVLGPDPALERDKEKVWNINPADAMGAALSGLIPYNNVVRYVSGASAHEKRRAAAFLRGQLRRSYLNGIASQTEMDCPDLPPFPSLKPPIEEK